MLNGHNWFHIAHVKRQTIGPVALKLLYFNKLLEVVFSILCEFLAIGKQSVVCNQLAVLVALMSQ